MDRRAFNKTLGLVTIGGLSSPLFSCSSGNTKLNVLVLGGTNFLGPAIVNSFSAAGHKVTLFNRGLTNPQLFPDLKKFKGDRAMGSEGYDALKRHEATWDVVIDVWPQNPQYVQEAITALGAKVGHYMFVSSIAVYDSFVAVGMNEDAPLRKGNQYEEGNYNLNKVLCEQVVKSNFPSNHTIVRPGAIVGDRDPGPFGLDLLNRIATRKEMFAPNSDDPVQIIDASDIGNFLNRCAEKRQVGNFNLVGPDSSLSYRQLIEQAKKALDSQVKIHWVDPIFLTEEMQLEPFVQVPFWIPTATDPEPGFYQISNSKALEAGLKFTDLQTTIRRSHESVVNKRFILEEGYESFFGISSEKEDEIINAWKAPN